MQILHAREAHIRLDYIWDCFQRQDVGVAVIDSEDRLVLCTPAASRLLNRRVISPGRTPGFPLGEPISHLVAEVRRDGGPVHEVVTLDGGQTVDVSLSPLGTSVLAVLDEAPELQASLRHQQLLTGAAYHELRNPLTTVIGYLGRSCRASSSSPTTRPATNTSRSCATSATAWCACSTTCSP